MRIIVIAGPNGAGKTMFAREYLPREGGGAAFVNGDEIAAALNPGDPAAAAQQAGRIALREMEEHVAAGEDFAVETTLSGRAYARRMRRWQGRGYRVAIVYLRLPSAEHAVVRVARRVGQGGHHIPEAVIRRRFARSWPNFVGLYRDVADAWLVYDNSDDGAALVAQSERRQAVRERSPTLMIDESPGIPEGEPSNESVGAALARARERALARAAAVRSGEYCADTGSRIVQPEVEVDGIRSRG